MSSYAKQSYRIVSRKTAVAIMLLVISLGCLAVWLGLGWVATYSGQLSELVYSDPNKARVKITRDLRLLAVITGTVIGGLAAFLFTYGLKSHRTQSMPPRDSWLIEGQKIRTGQGAVFKAKLLLFASVVILLLGIAAATMLWHVPVEMLATY